MEDMKKRPGLQGYGSKMSGPLRVAPRMGNMQKNRGTRNVRKGRG